MIELIKREWKLVLSLILAAIALLFLASWVMAKFDLAKAKATDEAQRQYQAQLSQQVNILVENQKQITETIAKIQQDEKASLAAIDAKFEKAQSPQDVAKIVASLMQLKQPITFVTPPSTPENPHPSPVAQISTEDTPQVKAYVQACEECKVKLTSAAQQLDEAKKSAQNFEDQLNLKELTIQSQNEQITKWKNAANGGSKWQKFGRALKVVGCAAGGAALGSLAGGSQPQQRAIGGGIGGGTGAVLCSLF